MSAQQSFDDLAKQYLMPVLLAVILVFVLIAMFSEKSDDDMHADFSARGSMQKGGYVNNEWADIEVEQINRNNAAKYNISPNTKGVIITERGGNRDVLMKLREGDVITGINGRKVKDLKSFREASQYVNPTEGMFLDIQRGGYPLFVSISGVNPANGGKPPNVQNPRPFSLTDPAPFLGRDLNVGGLGYGAGIAGKPIEQWIEENFSKGYYACPNCGTLIPGSSQSAGGTVYCPNCGTGMIKK